MISTYEEALHYLYDNLPMFHRVGAAAIKKDLTNTLRLCEELGNPERKFRSIHVAGTNGKGSTCHMLASILQVSGYRTGLYTSPHLKNFTERIKVNGSEVSRTYVVDFINRIKPAIERIKPSFFEITVAMAFDYFAEQGVDIAVIETGLGGRLDSTNVITPLVSVITNISWDHKDILGDTLQCIASEKAGIIKHGVPVVISERQADLADVFISKAEEESSEIFFASDEYSARREVSGDMVVSNQTKDVMTLRDFPLKGSYQTRNLPGVIKTVDVLRSRFAISDEDLRRGLQDVVTNTGLKGRWQVLHASPTVICDTAHNEGGIREIVKQIHRHRFRRLFIILGMVKDKDVKQVLALMPKDAVYYFCEANIPRALAAEELQKEAADLGLVGEVVRDVNEAKRRALSVADKEDLIYIGGSTYVVAELEDL
jgi:dihydrofolate synthase/folylpolyglutamate synthase